MLELEGNAPGNPCEILGLEVAATGRGSAVPTPTPGESRVPLGRERLGRGPSDRAVRVVGVPEVQPHGSVGSEDPPDLVEDRRDVVDEQLW
ncbi:MAG: hypothetical protein ACREEC_11320, partial [Thermoplasmata archaeon]